MTAAAAQPDALVTWMECLAEPSRLRLLRLLERNELGVVELCDVMQLPQSTVSRHLKVLSDQGWLRGRRQGTNHFYRTVLDELEPPARRLWLLAREQTAAWATAQQDESRLAELLKKRQSDSQAFFAGAAAKWDRLREELYGRSFEQIAMLALLPAEWVVADLGCGTGQVAAQLAGVVRLVIAVDNSAEMLKAAKRRMADLPNVELRRGDLDALPIEDASCDAAMLLLALTYVPEPTPALKEMARILKPGGRAVIVDLLPHDRESFRVEMGQQAMGFDVERVRELMSAAGLTDVTVRPLSPEANVKGPALFIAAGNVTVH